MRKMASPRSPMSSLVMGLARPPASFMDSSAGPGTRPSSVGSGTAARAQDSKPAAQPPAASAGSEDGRGPSRSAESGVRVGRPVVGSLRQELADGDVVAQVLVPLVLQRRERDPTHAHNRLPRAELEVAAVADALVLVHPHLLDVGVQAPGVSPRGRADGTIRKPLRGEPSDRTIRSEFICRAGNCPYS